MLNAVRSGAWLTQSRFKAYCRILIFLYVAIFSVAFLTAHGPIDSTNKPLGTDFSEVWVAGRTALAGHPDQPFYGPAHELAQQKAFGPNTPFYGWHYPPYFLILASILALLPYIPALLVWQGSTLALYLLAMRRIADHPMATLCALAFPAVYINLGHGHNGFLTAALIGFGCLMLERRQGLAGVLFGLMAYKPQFGIVIPVALLAIGAWRSIAAAAATVLAMTALTILLFGTAVWRAFLANLWFTRQVVLEQGDTGWQKIQSTFAAVRMLGGSIDLAYAAQSVVTTLVVAALAWLWYRPADRRLKAAALTAAALLSTPYCLDYDMMLLGPGLAFIASHDLEKGFRPWDISLLAAIWASPLAARALGEALHLPIGLAAIAALFVMAVSKGLRGAALNPTAMTAAAVDPC